MNRVFCFCLVHAASAFAGDLQLTLPPVVYATPDVEMSIYHDNIVLTETPQGYRFEFTCDIGKNEAQRWTATPRDSDVGDHPIAITVKDASGKVLEQGRTTLHVSPRKAGDGKTLRFLIIGDSLSSDMQGGLNYGIDTCWYNPQRQPGRLPVTYEIHQLADLPHILNGSAA